MKALYLGYKLTGYAASFVISGSIAALLVRSVFSDPQFLPWLNGTTLIVGSAVFLSSITAAALVGKPKE